MPPRHPDPDKLASPGSRIVRLAVAPVLLLVGMAAWFAPFEIGGRLTLEGKIFASRSWTLERTGQGLQAILRDRHDGVTSSMVVQSVDRGDVAAVDLSQGIRAGVQVEIGDSVATLGSALFDELLAEMAGDELIAAREAAAMEAGEQQAVIDEMKVRLAGLGRMIVVQERIAERMRQLVDRAGESVLELDRVEAELISMRAESEVIQAGIAVLEAGGRPEDRRVATARLEAAPRSLQALARRRDRFVIRSPIAGIVTRPLSDSVLVAVMDTTEWVVAVALPVGDRDRVRAGQGAIVRLGQAEAYATVLDIEPAVSPLVGPSVVLTMLRVDAPPAGALDGLRVRVDVETPPESVRGWMLRRLAEVFRPDQWLTNRGSR